jgi:hypothetical protein
MYHAADPIDAAADQEQKFLDMAIKKNSVHTKRHPKKPGLCDYCEDSTGSVDKLFCSTDCRDSDHQERRLLALNGRF